MNSLTMQFGTDTFATANKFGGAFGSSWQSQIQSGISNRLADGAFSMLLVFSDLDDLAGVDDPSLQIGVLRAFPVNPPRNPSPYSGQSDLDWWYAAEFAQTNATGAPNQQLPASLAAKALSAGPGYFTLKNPLSSFGTFAMSSTVLRAVTGNAIAPVQSTNGFPPGHVLSESVPAGLTSFSVMTNGQLKGNISAESLALMPVPQEWQGSQFTPSYSSVNTMLDVMIGGLRAFGGLVTVVIATQPDQVDPNVPTPGTGGPYRFIADPTTHKVTICRDSSGAAVALDAGLKAAAYSAYFKFTTDRVIWIEPPAEPPKLTISQLGANQFHLMFTNTPNLPFTVLMTTNLTQRMIDWTVLGSPTQTGMGIYEFVDPNAGNQTRRVYGARSP